MVSPKGKLADPIWPDSKDLSLHRLLVLAFAHDRIINYPSHSVLLELKGEV
jgi:hypothetical protein